MRRRAVSATVVAAALLAGGGTAWAVQVRDRDAGTGEAGVVAAPTDDAAGRAVPGSGPSLDASTGAAAPSGTSTSAAPPVTSAPDPAVAGTVVDPACATTYDGPTFYSSVPAASGDGSNGRLAASQMTALSWGVEEDGTSFYLRSDAAAALERLNRAFRDRFGHDLELDLAYRDHDTQVAMREALGTVAARPGTSSHGWGTAIDLPEMPCEYGWDTPQRDWLVANGPDHGWVQPAWAGRDGSNPEYWHFEYTG